MAFIGFMIGFSGLILLLVVAGWKVALAAFLCIWGNNLMMGSAVRDEIGRIRRSFIWK